MAITVAVARTIKGGIAVALVPVDEIGLRQRHSADSRVGVRRHLSAASIVNTAHSFWRGKGSSSGAVLGTRAIGDNIALASLAPVFMRQAWLLPDSRADHTEH